MNEETRASRGATAGLRNAFLAARTETYATEPHPLQAKKLGRRFGLTPAVAAAVASLAYQVSEKMERRI